MVYLEDSDGLGVTVGAEGEIGLGDDLVDARYADVGAADLPVGYLEGTSAPSHRGFQGLESGLGLVALNLLARVRRCGVVRPGLPQPLPLALVLVLLQLTGSVREVLLGLVARHPSRQHRLTNKILTRRYLVPEALFYILCSRSFEIRLSFPLLFSRAVSSFTFLSFFPSFLNKTARTFRILPFSLLNCEGLIFSISIYKRHEEPSRYEDN
jgi:hypothetical protein